MARAWIEALLAAGVTPATFVPDASQGRFDQEPVERAAADVLEDAELATHAVSGPAAPPPAAFLDGIQQWRGVGYEGLWPIVRGGVAGARGPTRRRRAEAAAARGPDGRHGTAHQRVPRPRRPCAQRRVLVVPAAVAVGGERPVVRAAADRGPGRGGDDRGGGRGQFLAARRAGAGLDPGRALGPSAVSYT